MLSIFAVRFMVSATFYSMIPFALVLLEFSPGVGAGLLTTVLVVGRILAWPAGRWIDKQGPFSPLMGVAILAFALLSFAILMSKPSLLMVALCGLAVLNPFANVALRALVAREIDEKLHTKVFGRLGACKTIGIAVGPALAAPVTMIWGTDGLPVLTTCLAALTVLLVSRLPNSNTSVQQAVPTKMQTDRSSETGPPLSSSSWSILLIQWALVWCCLYTLTVALAPYLLAQFGSVTAATVFFVFQSLFSAGLLIVGGNWLSRRQKPELLVRSFCLGAILPALALCVAGLWPSLFQASFAIALAFALAFLVAVSEALTVPSIDTLAATGNLGRAGERFGQLTTAEVFGMALSGPVVYLISPGRTATEPADLWVAIGLVAAVVTTILTGVSKKKQMLSSAVG